MESPNLTFLFCLFTLFTYIYLIVKHKTVLMGFTIMASLQVAINTISYFFISYSSGIGMEEFGPYHYFVYNYMAASLIAMAAGIWLAWRPLRENKPLVNPFVAEPDLIKLFAVIGAIALFLSVVLPNISTLSAIIQKFYSFLAISVIAGLVLWRATKNSRPLLFAAAVFLPTGILYMAISGHVSILGAFLLHPLLVFCCWRRPRVPQFLLMFAGLFLFYVVGGVWLEARLLLRTEVIKGNAFEKAVQFVPEFIGQILSFESFKLESIQQAARNRLDLSSFQVAQAAYMPEGHPYDMGKGLFLDPIAAIIPRFLWPNKTFTMGDNEHINKYTGAAFKQDAISVDTVIAFDFYANFGWIGVVFGMFLFGYLSASLELKLFTKGVTLRRVFIYCMILLSFSTGGRRVSVMAMEIGAGIVGSLLLAEFLKFTGLFRTTFNKQVVFTALKNKRN